MRQTDSTPTPSRSSTRSPQCLRAEHDRLRLVDAAAARRAVIVARRPRSGRTFNRRSRPGIHVAAVPVLSVVAHVASILYGWDNRGVTASPDRAMALWREGTSRLLQGDLDEAVASLHASRSRREPSAEAYTFRGWAFSFQGRLRRRHRGVPQGDRDGSRVRQPVQRHRLLSRSSWDAARRRSPWFEQAKRASRLRPEALPVPKPGTAPRLARRARRRRCVEFEGALAENPGDPIASQFIEALRLRVN